MGSPLALQWYVAVLVLESSIVERWSESSVDVQFRLIRAPDAESAYERALALGREAERAYENPYGQTCAWTFKGLKDLQEVIDDELVDGVEIYGFIEDGTAADHVLPKEALTVFQKGALTEDGLDPEEWWRES
jgi:hypothetical protein